MKPLRRFLDKIGNHFKKDGKLEKLYPLYEAGDTFLYTDGKVTKGASHIRDGLDLKRLMSTVVIALIPCIFMAMHNTGYQANVTMSELGISETPGWRGAFISTFGLGYDSACMLDNIIHGALYFIPVLIVCFATGGFWEVLFGVIRKHDVNEGFLVTGMLIPLTLPPTIPLWQVILGTSFGVVIGKEVFGGTGKNFLNPALTARAFLYFAYPAQITGSVWTAVDGYSGATPLGALAAATPEIGMKAITDQLTWSTAFLGNMPGSMGETSTLACLMGAFILIVTGIGSWRIMAGVLAGGIGGSTILWGFSGHTDNMMFSMPPWWHLVLGGFAFGLVFMATDPVSASMTETGKWIYGILIGAMTILIRVINPAFPEGIMLAILFGNVFAPLIDYFVIQANIKRRIARNAT